MEAPRLRPLPSQGELDAFRLRPRKVSHDCLVSFGGASYGVPFRYAGKTCFVLPKEQTIEISDDQGELMATHAMVFKSRKVTYLPGQYRGLDASNASRVPVPRAHERAVVVEQRDLSVYEAQAHG